MPSAGLGTPGSLLPVRRAPRPAPFPSRLAAACLTLEKNMEGRKKHKMKTPQNQESKKELHYKRTEKHLRKKSLTVSPD